MRRNPLLIVGVLGFLCLAACLAFMTLGARGSWTFILGFRGTKLLGILLVAYAIALSTVLFQTITNNRILTPSIMGFDSLYGLLQTLLVAVLGAASLSTMEPRLTFVLSIAIMMGFSLILFRLLFSGALKSLHLLMLSGIVLGVLFRSLSGFIQRVLDPNDFVVLQDRLFANFNSIDAELLGVSFALVGIVSLVAWRIGHSFDVLALGRETAISLGLDYKRLTLIILILVSVLVSVSTALVGPATFFGVLVANLAYILMPSPKHRFVIPAAVLLAVLLLAGGQTLLEHVFSFNTALSIIIEFAGGIFFILFLLRGAIR
ncbi:iron chelate uptake ABC transporter family permease subunit [Rhizobium helianthi]|uniref:Iron chelate uptake ABC transporter family permease subunit n=1 Tax=Rhizobium helianthi TaxID=1132695 RepID=A0ABW4M563_9HYPH